MTASLGLIENLPITNLENTHSIGMLECEIELFFFKSLFFNIILFYGNKTAFIYVKRFCMSTWIKTFSFNVFWQCMFLWLLLLSYIFSSRKKSIFHTVISATVIFYISLMLSFYFSPDTGCIPADITGADSMYIRSYRRQLETLFLQIRNTPYFFGLRDDSYSQHFILREANLIKGVPFSPQCVYWTIYVRCIRSV